MGMGASSGGVQLNAFDVINACLVREHLAMFNEYKYYCPSPSYALGIPLSEISCRFPDSLWSPGIGLSM